MFIIFLSLAILGASSAPIATTLASIELTAIYPDSQLGSNNRLFVRGEGCFGLNWNTGALMTKVSRCLSLFFFFFFFFFFL
jgi:hypothetical protein